MRVSTLLLASTVGWVTGCGAATDRTTRAPEVALLGVPAERTVAGVTIRAEAGSWHGSPAVLDEVTPVRLTITHRGDLPLRIHYSDLELVDHAGRSHAALPPFDLRPDLGPGGDAIRLVSAASTLSIDATRFAVAPGYHRLYPDVPIDDRLQLSRQYYERHYTYWKALSGPTPQMLESAIPEGVLEPGGSIDGYVFFERADVLAGRLDLIVHLMNPDTHAIFATARLPLLPSE